jgi:hypothetical protein
LVLRTFLTISSFITASQTIDFPRPSIQLTAAGFLSEQKLPDSRSQRYLLVWGNIIVAYKDIVFSIYWSCLTHTILGCTLKFSFLCSF